MHRWFGVAVCLAFVVWFSSGIVMLFVPFPSLPDSARRAGSEPLVLAQVKIAPAMALAASGGGDGMRLISVAGQPRYVVDGAISVRSIDAHSGVQLGLLNSTQAREVATRFAHARVRRLVGPLQVDQWSVHQHFDTWRPFYRVELDDAAGTELYVSARSGEVMQRTRASERRWNWLGAIPHWLYFTVLRHDVGTWDRTVWWVALAALIGAMSGTLLGLYRTWQIRMHQRAGWSAFRGVLRWHHGLGLGGAAIVLVWIFSGWLSMDHGRLFSRGQPLPQAVQRYAAASLQKALAGVAPGALQPLDRSGEIAFSVVGGQAWASGRGGGVASATLALSGLSAARMSAQARRAAILAAAAKTWPLAADPDHSDAQHDDALYREADAIPDDALRLALARPQDAALYVDAQTGRPLLQLDASRKAYAWLYFALHTTRLPGLSTHSRLRLALQLTLLAIGWCLSMTGVILAYRRLRASVRPRAALRVLRPRRIAEH
ncbi:hypothetical protein CVO74_13730 [Xanthomonas prunicola]|uniref:Peptidase n=1 Tax=Xanthomonas prunicola TaxID=2053930 RepID=A0A2N3RKA2_9XANT|nr:hypothetical protein XpruCFBP8353_11785 [Xanthomonas prunicola]PKV17176.1 hypothetical protein XpruCFBP8354_11785 [Xanthomonas prunicola]PKV21068.1 hypothetical protein CVO74_13730 [Xanthomonas prunicola]